MGVRELLNNNSSLVTIIAVVVLVIALGIIVMTNKSPGHRGPTAMYYYDLNTETIFIVKDPTQMLPPIDTPSGPTLLGEKAGVKAFIYSCGECEKYKGMTVAEVEEAGGFVIRLEKYTAKALETLEKARSGQGGPPSPMMMGPGMMMEGIQIKRPADDQWVETNSPAGHSIIMEDLKNRCPDGKLKLCLPGR